MPRGVTTAKTGSKVNMSDGTASDYARPKSARMSVCQRATESSTAGRNQATAHGKSSTVLAFGGKLDNSRGQAPEGSMTRRGPAARSEVERSLDARSFAATTASSSIRSQARGKNTACESDTVLFDKTKRQSMMTESMRHKPNAQAYQASSEASEQGRRAVTKRSQNSEIFSANAPSFAQPLRRPATAQGHMTSNIFSTEPVDNNARPLRTMNATATLQRDAAPSTRTVAEKQLDSQRRVISDGTENDRNMARTKSMASTIFGSSPKASKIARVNQAPAGSNIFGGGSFAEESTKASAMQRPRTAAAAPSSRPGFAAGGGNDVTAASRRHAALAGSGSLW